MTVAAPARIASIDALRGLTVAFMILVNDPGDWGHVYAPLDHAPWNGFTPTDLVFPTFLFLVGCSIVFSVSARLSRGEAQSRIALQIVRRAALIFLIKLLISAYPHFHLTHLRLYGVLTRIALCYLVTALLVLYIRSARTLAAITIALLIGYWLLMRLIPVPGLGMPVRDLPILDPDRNLAAWMDRGINQFTQHWLHTGRLYEKTRDPEGLLSTLPAIATTLLGVFAGFWLQRGERTAAVTRAVCCRGMALAGVVALALGALWSPWFPINKKLWTSSYVLFAGGWTLLLLALFYWFIDVRQSQQRSRVAKAMLWPLLVFGSNALTAFIFSEVAVESLSWWKLAPGVDGRSLSAWAWLYTHLFARHGSNENTSLTFAIAFVVVCFLPNWLLWRRRIFLRV